MTDHRIPSDWAAPTLVEWPKLREDQKMGVYTKCVSLRFLDYPQANQADFDKLYDLAVSWRKSKMEGNNMIPSRPRRQFTARVVAIVAILAICAIAIVLAALKY